MTDEQRRALLRNQLNGILDDFGRDEVWVQVIRVTENARGDDFAHVSVVNEGGTTMPQATGARREEHIPLRHPDGAGRMEERRRYRLWRDADGPRLDVLGI